MIRGRSRANPPLILLYGGPGMPETGFFRFFNAPLEDVFTVVYWEQRGSGRSFARSIPRSSMNVERFVSDLDELVEAVRDRLGSEKVAILGHSWGSVLGALYSHRFPEKVAAYVGVAQIGDWPAAESSSYAFALSKAQRLRDRKAMKKLQAIGPPPYDWRSVFAERTLVQRLDGQLNARTLWTMAQNPPCDGSLDHRSPRSDPRLPVHLRGHVARDVRSQPRRSRTRPADARVLLPRAQGPLRPRGDERRVLRRTNRAVEAPRLVRGFRA